MTSTRRCRFPVVLFLLLGGTVHRAAPAPATPDHVKATLVAADTAIRPGEPLTVALRLVHDPKWHTYWKNPGTGLPTALEWKLPRGWTAGEIQWPAPRVIKDRTGTITGNGYEDEVLLLVTLTPPTDLNLGDRVTLAARADWLMCEDICIPGGADVSLTLPVVAGTAPPDPQWGAPIRAAVAGLPRSDPAWRFSATRTDESVTLTVTPALPGRTAPANVRFFSQDDLIAYDQPQLLTPRADGGFSLALPISAYGPTDATQLRGVLTSGSGWLPDGALRGLQVAVDLWPGAASAANSSVPTRSHASATPGTLLVALLGGLILNLMPCVFPVLGLKILGFVNQAGHQRSKVVAHGLTFTAGVLASFWLLAGALALLRAGGDQLGWGFQLQSAAFVYAVTVLLLVFGLNLSGVFEFGLRATAVGTGLQSKSGYAGSFFTGVLATIVATPCSAPFLAPALGTALAVSTAASFVIFTAIAFGLALPYLALSIFPQAVKVLPRPGAWMETFKQFMAFPLYATVGYLVWVLAAQTGEEGFRGVLFSLVLIAMAVWMYGRWSAPGASAPRARFGLASLLVVGAFGLWVGWPRSAAAAGDGPPRIVWEDWAPEKVAQLRTEGRTIYVDFTARWCATCQTNKKLVFSSDAVLQYFAEHNIATLRGDWTTKDARITAELAKYGRSAVPFNVIWLPGRDEPVLLPEILISGVVLEALKKG